MQSAGLLSPTSTSPTSTPCPRPARGRQDSRQDCHVHLRRGKRILQLRKKNSKKRTPAQLPSSHRFIYVFRPPIPPVGCPRESWRRVYLSFSRATAELLLQLGRPVTRHRAVASEEGRHHVVAEEAAHPFDRKVARRLCPLNGLNLPRADAVWDAGCGEQGLVSVAQLRVGRSRRSIHEHAAAVCTGVERKGGEPELLRVPGPL